MRQFFIYYLAPFLITTFTAYFGERRTKIDPARDNREFEGRMIVAGTSVIFFIFFQLVFKCIIK